MAAPLSATPSLSGGGDENENGSESGNTVREEADRYVVKTLEMIVEESGKNFSAGGSHCFFFFGLCSDRGWLIDLALLRRTTTATRSRARNPETSELQHPHSG